MSRTYSSDSIALHASIVQERAFAVGVALSFAWIGCALAGAPRVAVAISIVGGVAFGITAGAWIVAERLKG